MRMNPVSDLKYFKELYRWKKPVSLGVESTNRCNLRCYHCHQSQFDIFYGDFDIDMFHRLMEEIDTGTIIQLSSTGEPLIAAHFRYMTDFLLKKGYQVAFTTNGLLIDKYLDLLPGRISGITISLDGASESVYQSVRGLSNRKVIDNLKALNEAKRNIKTEIPELSITTVLSNKNICDLPNVIHLANELGIKHVVAYHQLFYHDHDFKDQSLYFHKDISDKMHLEAIRLSKQYGINFIHTPLFGNVIPISEQRLADSYISRDKIHCRWINNTAIAGWNGVIYACCYLDKLLMGSLEFNSLDDIWNGSEYRKLRLAHLNRTPPAECRRDCIAMQSVDTSEEQFFRVNINPLYLQNHHYVSPLPYSFSEANLTYQKAVTYFQEGNSDLSLDLLAKLENADPNFFEVCHMTAIIYRMKDSRDKSATYFQLAEKACHHYQTLL